MNKNFPVSVVDNFFSNPDKVVKFAESLTYTQSNGFYPGKRTELIHKVNYDFFSSTIFKVLSLFFDLNASIVSFDDTAMQFQKIQPFNKKEKNHILNKGLIHQDESNTLAGVIYLTKKPDLDSGTSLYQEIKKDLKAEEYGERKKLLYKIDQKKLSQKNMKDYEKLIMECNQSFEEVINVKNVYNRLILYPGNYFHTGNYFTSKERLTLVFFMKILNTQSPLPIIRKNNIDEKI